MIRGVIYVAFGIPALECVAKSMRSLKQHMGGIPVCVISGALVANALTIIETSSDRGGRSIKTRLNRFAPNGWDQVLYMDADTIVLKPLERFFEPLEKGWDLVMCKDEHAESVEDARLKMRSEFAFNRDLLREGSAAQFAGGLFSWNVNRRTNAFFETWYQEWIRFRFRDQGALTRALLSVPLRVWPIEYFANAKHRYEAGEVWHCHGRARQKGAQ